MKDVYPLSDFENVCLCGRRCMDALIATCKRHAQNLLGLDLSQCQEWLPLLQVHYQRPPHSMKPEEQESTEVCTA